MRIERTLAAGALLLALLCSATVRAQVLDQVPGDAMLVLKVKNLDSASKKIAKFAKDNGFDQLEPDLNDALGTLAEKAHLSKGLNRNGDMAIALLDPEMFGGKDAKSVVVLLPTSDYKTFLTNFKASEAGADGISKVMPEGASQEMFVASWGQYAAMSPVKAVIAKKPTGLKLTGLSAKEAESKDAFVYANMKMIRAKVLPELTKGRAKILQEVEKNVSGVNENAKKFVPLAKAAVSQLLNVAEEFMNDAHSATLGLQMSDAGIGMTVAADFEPTSYIGKVALQLKGTDASLLSGLPDRKYFLFGGSVNDPKVGTQVVADMLDPIIKELSAIDDTKKFAGALESMKKASTATTGYTMGYVAPKADLGLESVMQQISIFRGDAKVILASQSEALGAMNDLTKLMPQQKGQSMEFSVKPEAKTVAGVAFSSFETKMTFPEDDAAAQQAKKMLELIYGPAGMSGVFGAVNDKTALVISGGTDELIADSVAASKANADTLGATAGVRSVAAELPKNRIMAMYFDLGTLVNTGIRYAKGFGAPLNVTAPADLPPIGMTASAEGTALRFDIHIPNRLIQGMISTGMKAYQQMNNPNGGL